MRIQPVLASLVLIAATACGSDGNRPDPRVIPGGGVSDGAIDGLINVYVIDGDTDAPIASAMVGVADVESATDTTGLVVVEDVKGAQTIAVRAQGYTSVMWGGVNGANVTIPLTLLDPGTPPQATLTGTITGFDAIAVAPNHFKAAVVAYTQTDDLGNPDNELVTPGMGNICTSQPNPTCAWTLVSRTGTLHVVAAMLDIDSMGTIPQDDDVTTITGYAQRSVTVQDGVNQSGLALDMIEAGNIDTVTIDMGTPPAALTDRGALVGIEIAADEVLQIPTFFVTDRTQILAPKLAAFAGSTYRLTAIAQTTSGDRGAQSILIRRGLTTTALAAGEWLVPPTGVTATRSTAAWNPVANALVHNVAFDDPTGKTLLEVSMFDRTVTTVTVPSLVALPTTGNLLVRVGGIGATLDPTDFSLDEDLNTIFGFAAEPVTVQ